MDVVLEQYKQKAALLSNLQTEQANMAQASAQYQQALAKFLERSRRFRKSDGDGLNPMSKRKQARQGPQIRYALALAVVLTGCGAAPQQSEPARPTPVAVAEVQEYSGGEGLNYSASIVPYTQLPIAFKSGGYVTNILQRPGPDGKPRNLQQGDYVKKDTVLTTVRQADYQHSVDQYKGQLEQAQAGRAQIRAGLRPRRRALQSQRAHAKRLRRRQSAI